MKKIAALIFTLFVAALNLTAQQYRTPKPIDSNWVSKPKIHPTPRNYVGYPAITLSQSDDFEYKYEGRGNFGDEATTGKADYKYQYNGVSVYHTLHKLIKIMDERGIERYNKIAIPFYHAANIRWDDLKARTISPDGKVYDIPPSMFKISEDENGTPEIIFAMEGVEKYAEVEYFIKEQMEYSVFEHLFFSQEMPILDYNFEMGFPKELRMEFKGYNGFPDLMDTLIAGRRHTKLHLKNIPELKTEPFSFPYLHLMRAEWRVNYYSYYAHDYSIEKQFTWDEMAKELYTNAYKISDTEKKAVITFLTSIGVTGSETELDKIIKIENGIKRNIIVYPVVKDNSCNLDTIISRKSATSFGIMKLFAACFKQTDVKCELGRATDRQYYILDEKFENWYNLHQYLIYFPHFKTFISPTNVLLRYPMVENGVLTNKGIFCKMGSYKDPTIRLADKKTIYNPTSADNYINLVANVSFEKNLEANVSMKYSYYGYPSVSPRTTVNVIPPGDRLNKYIESLFGIHKQDNLLKYSINNEGLENYTSNYPLEIAATIKATELVERAGNKYILKIGNVIGNHIEYYQEKERKLPVDISYPHVINRTINVTIPQGYKIANLNDLKINGDYVDPRTKTVAVGFKSDYVIKGNKLVITIKETYNQTHFHVSDYQIFRNAINAGADFNKVSLVLTH